MNAKTFLLILILAAAAGGGGYFVGRSTQVPGPAAAAKTLYTCGMHPQVIQDHPGNCPICGMKLTPIRDQAGAAAGSHRIKYYTSTMKPGEISQTPGKDSMGMEMVPVYDDDSAAASLIQIDPVTTQNMGIRTERVETGPQRQTLRTVATISFDETTQVDVNTKFNGWIEKLQVDATGQQVHRGEPLFDIYSPELYSAQTEYLQALKSGIRGDASLLDTTRLKLKYYDISDAQIAELEKSREPRKTLQITAPADGFVMEKMVVQGMMVQAGMKLYRIADLGIVWVYAQVYEKDLPFVSLGQEAVMNLSYLADRKFRGRVTYIYPTIDEQTRTARIRMEFHNPGYFLKPGMFASVELTSLSSPTALLVPEMAVLRSGEDNTVFVALDGGRFEPRRVTLGPRVEGEKYVVLSGLSAGERVVTSGQFMLDSESQLREAIQKMEEPGARPPSRAAGTNAVPSLVQNGPPTATNAPAAAAQRITYICPMPEHVSIEYDHPGNCPICGMKLVPVTADLLRQIHPGGTIKYYTCPMPEHADVHSAVPGKCPRCGMTLIPVMEQPPVTSSARGAAPEAVPSTLPAAPER